MGKITAMEPVIKTVSVKRVFKSGGENVYALNDVSISVMPGTFAALRGRSGSGKTTLMNILGALDRPTDGQVFFEGAEIGKLPENQRDELRRHKLGFVFQASALIPLMSAYENVEFSLRIAGVPTAQRRKRAEEVLALVGLSKRMKHRPMEMSGGEQQRVAIARAMAHNPSVILADEPTAQLDSRMGLQIMKLFRDLVDKEGITIVMATHDPIIMEVADHVYTLEDGKVVDEQEQQSKVL